MSVYMDVYQTYFLINMANFDLLFCSYGSNAGNNQMRGNRRHFKGGRNHFSVPNANAPSELRNMEQVRKNRQHEVSRIARLKNKSKGNKSHGNKKRGKQRKN